MTGASARVSVRAGGHHHGEVGGRSRRAEAEFGGAALNDARLSARLVTIAQLKGARPMASFPQAASGDWAGIKGYCRFIDQPEKTAVTPAAILAPHRARTPERMRAEPVALCIQDGTDLNFASRPGCAGLGVIGSNQTGAIARGLHLHSTLAVTPSGLPPGVSGPALTTAGTGREGDVRREDA